VENYVGQKQKKNKKPNKKKKSSHVTQFSTPDRNMLKQTEKMRKLRHQQTSSQQASKQATTSQQTNIKSETENVFFALEAWKIVISEGIRLFRDFEHTHTHTRGERNGKQASKQEQHEERIRICKLK